MKILVADDHALFRDAMQYLLQELAADVTILEAGNFNAALQQLEQHPDIDLLLLDLNLPGSHCRSAVSLFHEQFPKLVIVVVSGSEMKQDIRLALDQGAMGYVPKAHPKPQLLGALRLVLDGGIYLPPQLLRTGALEEESELPRVDRRTMHTNEHGLTQRQMEALFFLAEGLSNKEIAIAMKVAEGTAKVHIAAIYQQLGVSGRVEAVRLAETLGLITPKI